MWDFKGTLVRSDRPVTHDFIAIRNRAHLCTATREGLRLWNRDIGATLHAVTGHSAGLMDSQVPPTRIEDLFDMPRLFEGVDVHSSADILGV